MEVTLFWALILALTSPFFWALSNVIDKYIVSHKTKNAKSYTAIAAMAYVVFGILVGVFLNWDGIGFNAILFPALSGISLGICVLMYFVVMQKEDATHMIGIIYIYPLVVAFLSAVILHERLSWIGYLGAALAIVGTLMLSARLKEIKLRASLWMLLLLILFSALYEFFLKIAIVQIPIWNGIAVNEFFVGLTGLLILLRKDVRSGFMKEIKNLKWAFLSEGSIFIGIITTYISLVKLPVSFVSSVAVTQPLAVLIFEGYAHKYFGKMRRDHLTGKKAIAISIMVLGIILLYVSAPSL